MGSQKIVVKRGTQLHHNFQHRRSGKADSAAKELEDYWEGSLGAITPSAPSRRVLEHLRTSCVVPKALEHDSLLGQWVFFVDVCRETKSMWRAIVCNRRKALVVSAESS